MDEHTPNSENILGEGILGEGILGGPATPPVDPINTDFKYSYEYGFDM